MFSTFRWVFKYCYCDRPQSGITYSGAFLQSFLAFFVHFVQPYHIVSFILVCPLGFRTSYGSQFPSCSFSLVPSSPFVPVGDFDLFLFFFFFFFFLFILFYTYVFFPPFLYRIAAAWLLRMRASAGRELTVRTVWSRPLQTQFISATVWYWFQDNRQCGLALSPSSFPVTLSLLLGA